MAPEQLDTPPERQGGGPEQSEPKVTLRQKFRSAEDRVAAGKARIAEPYGAELLLSALITSLWKFDPRVQIRNPVMFVVWLGAVVTAALTLDPSLFGPSGGSAAYNGVVTVILLVTVWFANFAEALAEGRGKAKAASLRRTRMELMARRVLTSDEIEQVPATALRKDDVIRVDKGEIEPGAGQSWVRCVMRSRRSRATKSTAAFTMMADRWVGALALSRPGAAPYWHQEGCVRHSHPE
jgi:hypothetical protein